MHIFGLSCVDITPAFDIQLAVAEEGRASE